jgi:hypothetical protein
MLHKIEIRPRNIDGIRVVRAVRVKPNTVSIQLGQEGERPFLVKAQLTGEPVGGTVVVECDPASVRVTGPVLRLDELQESVTVMLTEPVSIDGITESFSERVRVQSPSEHWDARIEPLEVTVHVRLEKRPATRTMDKIPVSALVDPSITTTVELRPTDVSIVLEGQDDVLESYKEADIRVFVDCEGLDMGATYKLPLTVVVLGKGDIRAVADPPTVEVVLSETLQLQRAAP